MEGQGKVVIGLMLGTIFWGLGGLLLVAIGGYTIQPSSESVADPRSIIDAWIIGMGFFGLADAVAIISLFTAGR